MIPELVREELASSALGTSALDVFQQEPTAPPSPVKITYFLGSLQNGGTERQVLELLRHLDRTRFEPSLILMEGADKERAQGLVKHCFVLGVPQAGSAQWFRRSTSLANAVLHAREAMERLRTDIVHALLPGPSILGGMAARMAGVPLIIGSRRSLPSQYRRGRVAAGWADTLAFHLAHFNLGNSHAVTREMIHIAHCPARKCGTVYNGVDIQRFRPEVRSQLRQQFGWTHDEVVFGQVANFRLCKRQGDFVEMAATLAAVYPGTRFLLAGADQGTRAAIERQIEACGLDGQVQVLHSGLPPQAILAALDVYVSTSEAEGFSNAILEAMACGKPVLATDVGGTSEAVRHGQSGFLIPPGNVPALAERAATLLANAPLRKIMGTTGRRIVEAEFSLAAMVGNYQELYRKLFNRRVGSKA